MSSNGETKKPYAVIGHDKNFWLYDSQRRLFDLTHPPTPTSDPVSPRFTVETTTRPIVINPSKSALLVIDMQNFFLSSAFGRAKGSGHDACDQLASHAIPAARKAGIRVVYVNWGLTQNDLAEMPPSITRAFGFEAELDGAKVALDKHGDVRFKGGDKQLEDGQAGRKYAGLGHPCGIVPDPVSGRDVDAGKMLMRDQWNTALYAPLDGMFEEGRRLGGRPDVWVHKNRMSGLWGGSTPLEQFLEKEGIRTLFFSGVRPLLSAVVIVLTMPKVNTDQCVSGTHMVAFSKGYVKLPCGTSHPSETRTRSTIDRDAHEPTGCSRYAGQRFTDLFRSYDCILLNDGCGTTSPDFAQQCVEYNAANTHGFSTTCKAFAEMKKE